MPTAHSALNALNAPQSLLDVAYRLDPTLFAIDAGLTPDPWQARVLRSTAPRLSINVTRQGGKSAVSSILGLLTALYTPDSLVLIVSPSQRQSAELFRKLLTAYRTLDRPVAPIAENAFSLELVNGSRIVALPGHEETTRGFSAVRLLIIDEASRVADALYHSVTPMLAVSAGRLVTMSTPWGKRGWWYAAWEAAKRGEEDWERYEVPATDCPRIPAAFLAEQRRSKGDLWYSSEFCCSFVDVTSGLFSADAIDAAFASGGDPFFPDLDRTLSDDDADGFYDHAEGFAL